MITLGVLINTRVLANNNFTQTFHSSAMHSINQHIISVRPYHVVLARPFSHPIHDFASPIRRVRRVRRASIQLHPEHLRTYAIFDLENNLS